MGNIFIYRLEQGIHVSIQIILVRSVQVFIQQPDRCLRFCFCYETCLYICQKKKIYIFYRKHYHCSNQHQSDKGCRLLKRQMEPVTHHDNILILRNFLWFNNGGNQWQNNGYAEGFQQCTDKNQKYKTNHGTLLFSIQ